MNAVIEKLEQFASELEAMPVRGKLSGFKKNVVEVLRSMSKVPHTRIKRMWLVYRLKAEASIKPKKKSKQEHNGKPNKEVILADASEENKPKRKRGRPKKSENSKPTKKGKQNKLYF